MVMQKERFRFTWKRLLVVYMAVYFVVNLLFLTKFPFMHSDESWLSGLTRSMIAGGPAATESFFDLFPRNPHAIKTIFHGIQALFSFVFGYNLFAFRLVSLVFGILLLSLTYKLVETITKNTKTAFFSTLAASVCVQFIYASHFARQEIIIAAALLGIIYYLVKEREEWKARNDLFAALFTGLAIGIHPNSFLIALAAGSVYLFLIFFEKKMKARNLLIYIVSTGVIATVFVGLSFLMDPNFISNYLKYGSDLGVTSTVSVRYEGLFSYYSKLFRQSSGTYYTPNIRGEFIVLAGSAIGLLLAGIKNRKYWLLLFPLIAVNIGYIVIGRYSQPGILFVFILGIPALFHLVSSVEKKQRTIISAVICIGLLVNSIGMILPWLNDDYKQYIQEIKEHVPAEGPALANLNTAYAFDEGAFLDYRNLAYIYEEGLTFAEYVQSRKIEYIIYPEEMDLIYERRPVWNVVYGNVYPYYDGMIEFLETQCSLIHTFESPYAMRIVRFVGDKDWEIRIYKVD